MKKRKINLYLVFLLSMVFLVVANTTDLNISNITNLDENYTPNIIEETVLDNITFETNVSFELENISEQTLQEETNQSPLLQLTLDEDTKYGDEILTTLDGIYYPEVNYSWINPSRVFYTGYYGTSFYISANVTDFDENINSVNFTLIAPNGTAVYYNLNASNHSDTNVWNSTTFIVNQYGQWNYTVTVWDNDFASNSSNGTIRVMEISLNVNKTLTDIDSPINIYGRIINGTRQGAPNASFEIYLNDTLWWANVTDEQGYYNITLNTTTTIGVYNLWINSTHNTEYSEKNLSFEVQDLPNINQHMTSPHSFYYLGYSAFNFTIMANVTDVNLLSVNYTLTAPNGTVLINNVNATTYLSDWFNSSKTTLDQYGQWNYSIIAWDTDGYNDTVLGYIKVLRVTGTLNTSIAEQGDSVRVTGHLYNLDGTDLTDAIICINLNYTSYSEQYNCSVNWWDKDWRYRKKIDIDNLVATDLDNTLALINFSTTELISSGKMNSDCGDIRVVDSNGVKIYYTMETSTCDSGNTIIWIWNNFTSSSNNTVWVYYGNLEADLDLDYQNPDTSLKLLMHFDRSTVYGEDTFKFFDFSKNGNNGTTVSASRPWRVNGTYAYAYNFDGTNDYLYIKNSSSLNLSDAFTLSAWVNPEDLNETGYILSKTDFNSTGGYGMYWNGINNTLSLMYGSKQGVNSTADFIDYNQWVHVAISKDSSGNVYFYRNGVQVSSEAGVTTLNNNLSLILGNRPDSDGTPYDNPTTWFNGSIDELRIYNRSLVQNEILAIYNSTKTYLRNNETITKTDGNGDYDINFSAPGPNGIHLIVINTTSISGYGEQHQELRVMDFPTINTYSVVPSKVFYTGQYGTKFHLSSDVTDADSNLITVNYTLTAPNGTHIYYNLNATLMQNDVWNTTYKTIDQYGMWNYTITAWDSMNGSRTVKDSIKFLQLTQAMNSSIVPGNDSIRVSGNIYDENGNPAVNNSIFFYINGLPLNFTEGWNFESQGQWWNISWRERTNLKVRVNNSINLQDTLILVNFSTTDFVSDGKLKSNCSDLRFADVNGNELNFMIEPSTCNSENTFAWLWYNLTQYVNHTVYVYYDNDYASTKTNYDNSDNSLKLLMHFDNASMYGENDQNIYDFSKNNNNGTPTSLNYISSCKFGGCYEFDAFGDKIEVEDSLSLSFGDGDNDYPFTITSWIYMDDATDFQILNKRLGNLYAEYGLYVNNSDYLYFALYDNYENVSSYITTNLTMTSYENQWIFVVATYNGTGGHNGTKIYINTILQNITKRNHTGDYEYTAMHNEDCPLYIGSNQSELSANGKIDELRLYNRTMSQKEISALYNLTEIYVVSNYSFTRTDSQGYYNYTFTAPAELGEYEIKVNSTLNSVFGMINNTLLVTLQGNAPPEISSLEFNADSPSTSTNLECKATVTDAETETLTVEYWWFNQTTGSELYFSGNKTDVSNNTETVISILPHLNTSIDEIWNCTIRVYDSAKYSDNTSVKTQIVNILPNITSFTMLPNQPNTTSTIGCYATVLDESNSTPNVNWYWYNLTSTGYEEVFSGTTIVQNNTYTLITQLGLENTTTGETWNCTIKAYDGLEYSALESQASIVNTPPSIIQTSLNNNYNETANISCIAIAEDAENTSMQVEWYWYNLTSNGYEERFNGNSTLLNYTSSNVTILGFSNTSIGETWNCTVRVFDGSNKSSFVSSTTKITSIPNITDSSLTLNQDSDLDCIVKAVDDFNTTFNIEYYWYNQTTSSELLYKGNTTLINNTNTIVTTLAETITTNDEIWNCTIRAYDGYGYSNFTSHKRLIDKQLPVLSLNYPNASQILTQHKIEINYTINESNLNYTWYTHDYNGTKVELNYDTNEGDNLENITFAYPGKHIFTIYINDTFGNIATDNVTFFIVDYLNTSEWRTNYLSSQTNVTWLNFLDETGIVLDGNITLDQNVSLEINMTNITVYMYNFSSHEVIWDFFFEMYDNNSEVVSLLNTNYGKQPIDYVYIANFTRFNDNSSKYYGKIVLPSNNYDYLYYCAEDDLDDCVEVSQCTYNYTRLNTSACYIDINSKYHVYVPHFSAVIGANDTIAPTISFVSPINNSNVTRSYRQNISFIVNEQATCRYSFDESLFANLGTGTSFITYINYTQNRYRNITIICDDASSNSAISQIFYNVNDTDYPVLSSYDADTEEDEISLSFNTDEPANVSILLIGTELQKSASFVLSHSYTFSNLTADTSYTFNITLCDRLSNCHTTQETESTDAVSTINDGGGSSGSSSGGGGSTTTNEVVNQVFFSLSEGEHYISIASEEIAITRITFTMKNVVNGTILFTIQKKDLPSIYPGLTNPYQYVSIDKTRVTDNDISSIEIKFRVKNSWIENSNIDSDTISLYRYTSKWVKLNTDKTSSDSVYSYYEATSPGFSYFSIKGEENQVEEVIEPEPTDTIIANVIDEVIVDDNQTDNQGDSNSDTKSFNPMMIVIPIVVLVLIVIVVGAIVTLSQKSSSNSQPLNKPQKLGTLSQSPPPMQSFVQTEPVQQETSVEELFEIKQYVLLCRSEGIEESSIKKVLLDTGWQEKDVDHVMAVTQMPDEEIQTIIAYIKTLRQNNIPDEEIKQNLRKVGWQEYAIQEAFNFV